MSDGASEDLPGVTLPEAGTGQRARNRVLRQRQRRRQQQWVIGISAVLAVMIPILGYVGYHKVITTTEGRRVEAQNDPSRPNFEANVIPTPVLLFEQADEKGVHSITVLSLDDGDKGGAVLFVPVDTITDKPVIESDSTTTSTTDSTTSTTDTTTTTTTTRSKRTTTTTTTTTTTVPKSTSNTTTLAQSYLDDGQPIFEQLTANILGLSFGDVAILNDEQLAQFIAPATPLQFTNSDRLVEVDSKGRTTTAFPAGQISLAASDVPRYLGLRNPGESDLARLARQQTFWQAWIAAVKESSNPNIIPGETTSGLGRYLRGFARGDVRFASMPASATKDPDTGGEVFQPNKQGIADLVSSIVPLPTPANPGDRVRVRLLSGVGPLDAAAMLTSHLIPPDAQLSIIGNADRFDYTETQIVYYDDQFANGAAELQTLLGVGKIEKATTPADSEDVTVIIGQDLVRAKSLHIAKESTGG